MKTQVAKFSIDPSDRPRVEELISRWAAGPGKRLAGCERLATTFEEGGSDRVSVEIHFRDQAALDAFSEDAETLDIVEQLKPLVTSRLDYFEGDLQTRDLL